MSENKDVFFYSDPPKTESFQQLFLYFWNHGVGLKQDNGVPTPWNSDKLEAAFDDINRKIDIRTIDNWRAGNSIPRRKNLLALATIASRNDRVRRKIWAEAFVSHYENKNNEYLETKDYSNLTSSELNESRIPLAIIGLLSIVVLSALLYFNPFQKVSTIDQSGSDIRVQNFQNYTENPRFDLLIKGFESEIIDTFYQIDGVRVNLENSEPSKLENINVQCDLTGQENAYGLYCRIISTKGEILWSRRKQFEDPGDFIEIQSEIPGALTQVTNIVISDDAKARMRLLGTKSLDAYIAYLKGRKNLKAWHENRADSLMIDAFQGLSTAIATDPSWLEPKFHIVDIYHHIAAGDIKPFSEITPERSVERIPDLLSEAADRAANDFAKSKASMNAIYFSTDWTALNNYSKTYVTAATARRGELEWLFEPVILLVTGETELLRSLVTERILKFDSGNGTGHAYAVRSYLLDGNLQKARDRYDSSDLRSFSNRLEQIKGYLLFAENHFDDLFDHAEKATNLTPDYRDYFKILSLSAKGNLADAQRILETSSALKSNKVHHALAYFHIGRKERGIERLEEISSTPLGDLDIATEIAYGAACGLKSFELPHSLALKFQQADIKLPACIK